MSKLIIGEKSYMQLALNCEEGFQSARTDDVVVEVKDITYTRIGEHYATRMVVYDYNQEEFFEMTFIEKEGKEKPVPLDQKYSRDNEKYELNCVKMKSVTTVEFVK